MSSNRSRRASKRAYTPDVLLVQASGAEALSALESSVNRSQ